MMKVLMFSFGTKLSDVPCKVLDDERRHDFCPWRIPFGEGWYRPYIDGHRTMGGDQQDWTISRAAEQPRPGLHPLGTLAPPEPWGGVRRGNRPLALPRAGVQ